MTGAVDCDLKAMAAGRTDGVEDDLRTTCRSAREALEQELKLRLAMVAL